MIDQINNSDNFHPKASQLDLEFLEALLQSDDATYPWNPADPESEAYFQELEEQFASSDFSDEEFSQGSQLFYTQLDSMWADNSSCYTSSINESVVTNLLQNLQTAFANCIPSGWLEALAQAAANTFSTKQSISEQLVECVQAVLPTWGTEDLFPMTRNFALDMRDGEPEQLNNREWTSLSQIEQARVSMAIAHYALVQLNHNDSKF